MASRVRSWACPSKKTWIQLTAVPVWALPYMHKPIFIQFVFLTFSLDHTSEIMARNWSWSRAASSFFTKFVAPASPCADITLTSTFVEGDRLKTIWVANLVHRPESLGNGRPSVRASRTELFPLDWSPATISYWKDLIRELIKSKDFFNTYLW